MAGNKALSLRRRGLGEVRRNSPESGNMNIRATVLVCETECFRQNWNLEASCECCAPDRADRDTFAFRDERKGIL